MAWTPSMETPGRPDSGGTVSSGAAVEGAPGPDVASSGEGSTSETGAQPGGDGEWQEVARVEAIEEHLQGTCKVGVVEQCLSETGRERVRIQLVLQSRGGRSEELDIQARPSHPVSRLPQPELLQMHLCNGFDCLFEIWPLLDHHFCHI